MNPLSGVESIQVTIPEAEVTIELMPTPFELLIAIILWFVDSNPYIGPRILTLKIVLFGTSQLKELESTTVFEIGSKTIRLGGFR